MAKKKAKTRKKAKTKTKPKASKAKASKVPENMPVLVKTEALQAVRQLAIEAKSAERRMLDLADGLRLALGLSADWVLNLGSGQFELTPLRPLPPKKKD